MPVWFQQFLAKIHNAAGLIYGLLQKHDASR
jgi:hypothetical protein